MKTEELIVEICKRNNYGKTYFTRDVIETLVDIIIEKTLEGEDVRINGLGIFTVIDHKESRTINPYTKEEVIVPAYSSPRFRASIPYKNIIKGKEVNNE